jgi:hypothetical protein
MAAALAVSPPYEVPAPALPDRSMVMLASTVAVGSRAIVVAATFGDPFPTFHLIVPVRAGSFPGEAMLPQ